MKNSKNLIMLTALAVLILFCAFVFLRSDTSRATGKNDSGKGSIDTGQSHQESEGNLKRRDRAQENKCVDPRVQRYLSNDNYAISIAKLSGYLAQHQRSPESLVAAFLLSQDPAILAELRQHLDNSEAVMCLMQASSSPAERKDLIERYIKLNPNDMTGYLLNAWVSSGNQGGKSEQLALILKGISAETFTGGFGGTNAALSEALLSTGMTSIDAQIYLASNANATGRLFHTCIGMVASGCEMAVSGATTPEDKKDAAVKFLSAADSFLEISPYSFENGRPSYYNEVLKMLKKLPDDMVLESYGKTVAEYREKILGDRKELAQTRTAVTNLLSIAPPAQIDVFFEKRQNEGFDVANRWIIDANRK